MVEVSWISVICMHISLKTGQPYQKKYCSLKIYVDGFVINRGTVPYRARKSYTTFGLLQSISVEKCYWLKDLIYFIQL